jgi:hypothetical protein
MTRSPLALTSRTWAPSATATGAQSDDDTAQHRLLFGATQQIAPGFSSGRFMQKLMLFRQWYDWS